MIAYGILNRKRWAYNLLMMFGIPLAVLYAALTLVIFFLSDPKFTGVTLFTIFGVIIGLVLVGLQVWIVSRNKHQFTD
jgi:predicted MFS family arabinose efflux permease